MLHIDGLLTQAPPVDPDYSTTGAWVLAGHSAPPPAPKPVPVPVKPAPKPVQVATFRNVTCNVQGTDPAAQETDTVRDALAGADLVGWQELTDVSVAELRKAKGWAHFIPGGSAAAVSISWRTDVFTLVRTESIKVHGGQDGVTPTRFINVAVLRHNTTGQIVVRISTHVVHHIEAGGMPRKYVGAEVRKFKDQLLRAHKHFALLASTVTRYAEVGAVVWSGDLNVNYAAELHRNPSGRCVWFPLTVLSKVCTLAMPAHGTHGDRIIDWTGYTHGVTEDGIVRLAAGYSDHRAVQVTFRIST